MFQPSRSLFVFLTLVACDPAEPPTAAEPAPAPPATAPTPAPAVDLLTSSSIDDGGTDLGRAGAAARMLGLQLQQRMGKAMSSGGPADAVRVCADEAQGLTALIQGRTGVHVGRSSLRLRNPANAGPTWVQEWLKQNGNRPAADTTPLETVVDTPEGARARVAIPIAVQAPCLTCHGSSEQIAPEVRELLSTRYPDDAATGYAAGDLRGVLWAEAVVATN